MTRKGVWGLQQVRDKQLQSLWEQAFYLQAMGQGNYGEILNNENGDGASRSSPTQLGGTLATGWRSIDTGKESFLGTRDDGTLWVAGYNQSYGPLGQNNGTNYSSPTQVGTDTTWDTVKSKNYTSMAVKTDGTLWMWGRNSAGALGQNNNTHYSSPRQVGTNTTWTSKISAGYSVGAIKSDGTLWTWGSGGGGRLGHNSNTQYSSPKQVGTNTTWSKIVVSGSTMLSLKTDGTLWTWGNNEVGELGLNNKTNYSSPKQVGTDTTWSDVAGSSSSDESGVVAVKTDGTMWSWGGNEQGELGQNDTSDYSSPRQMGTGTDWKHVWGTYSDPGRKFWASKTDGTIWNWGNGNYGSLDHNNNSSTVHQLSSPTQLGTLTSYSSLNNDQVCVCDRVSYILKPLLTPSQL
tara:strand:+ start:307 stop:1518 length:1212 start_codon:yes stop_codon:yes gene_type:complete